MTDSSSVARDINTDPEPLATIATADVIVKPMKQSTEEVTASVMKIFMDMEQGTEDDEEKGEDGDIIEHVDKKRKTADKNDAKTKEPEAVVYETKLSENDSVKIALAALEYYYTAGERWDYGLETLPDAKNYAQRVFEKSKELKNTYGDSFDADEIVTAFDEMAAQNA
jgi:hypothetical protein